MSRSPNHISSLLHISLYVISLAATVLFFVIGKWSEVHFVNSDAVYLPVLFKDIMELGGSLEKWYLTPAPYFFPDFPIFFLAQLLGENTYQDLIIYFCLQASATSVAIFYLAKNFTRRNALKAAIYCVILMLWLASAADGPFLPILQSAYHFGAFLNAIIALGLVIRCLKPHKQIFFSKEYYVLIILAFVATLSDSLFFVQFSAPVAAAIIMSNLIRGQKPLQNFAVGISTLISSVLAIKLYPFLISHDTRYPNTISTAQMMLHLDQILKICMDALSKATVVIIGFFGLYLACTFYISLRLLRAKKSSHRSKETLLILFMLTSTAVTLIVLLIVKTLPIADRYLIPVFEWPIIVLAIVGLAHQRRIFHSMMLVGTLTIISLFIYELKSRVNLSQIRFNYASDHIACIDSALEKRRLRHGIAQYWDAKHIQAFSNSGVILAQVTPQLDEDRWITSENFFLGNYDFAVISDQGAPDLRLSEDLLSRINGQPRERISCGGRSLHIYGPGNLRTEKIRDVGHTFRWKGCELPHVAGHYNSDCFLVSNYPDSSGTLSHGPYVRLPSGEFQFEINYMYEGSNPSDTGDWDVVAALPKEARLITAGKLTQTWQGWGRVEGTFTVSSDISGARFEVRTRLPERSKVMIRDLLIKRTK